MAMSTFFENPIVEKATAGIIIAAATAFGAMALSTRDKVVNHEAQLKVVSEIRQDLKNIQVDVNTIKLDTAILKERVKDDVEREAESVR